MRILHVLLLAALVCPALPSRASDGDAGPLTRSGEAHAGLREITRPLLAESPDLSRPAVDFEARTPSPDRRSPLVALSLALAAPLVTLWASSGLIVNGDPVSFWGGLGLEAASFILLPSLGHVYVGDWRRVAWMTGARLATAGVFVAALSQVDWFSGGDETAEGIANGAVIVLLGLIAWDVVDAPFAAVRHNRALERPRVAVAPWVARGGGGGGLALAGRFR